MSKSTIVVRGGRRLVIQPSRTSPGVVSIIVLGADRQEIASVSLDVACVGALMQSIHAVGLFVEGCEQRGCRGDLIGLPVLGEVA